MHSSRPQGAGSPQRYSARNNLRAANFVCHAPEAKHVSLIGDFNDWHPNAHPMKRHPDGAWATQVLLCHGHHHYLFYVDGKERLDPRSQGTVRTAQNVRVSLIAIS